MSFAVGCGTPAQPITPPRELPPQAADAGRAPDAPTPDAPPPDAMVVVDAAPPLPPDAAIRHKGKVTGRVFRKDGTSERYPEIWLTLASAADPSFVRRTTAGPAKKGAYELADVPPGNYVLYIADETYDGDAQMTVAVKRDEHVKLDIDLNRIALRVRPPKPYGAPPARRRVV